MIRAILAGLLLFTSMAAGAIAPKCWPDLSLPVRVETLKAPAQLVAIGSVVYAASTVGIAWGYSCRAADGQHYKVIAAGAWDAMPRDWAAIADTLLRGTDADRAAAWDKYATASEWDPRLKPDLDAVWALLPVPPPVARWTVLADPFRADKQRLVYTVVSGKRGPATNPARYVAAGVACDPIVTIAELGPSYFLSVLGDPNLVARCVKP